MNSNPGAIRACAMGLFDFALFDQFAILRNCKDFDYNLFDLTPGLGIVKRDHHDLAGRCFEQH